MDNYYEDRGGQQPRQSLKVVAVATWYILLCVASPDTAQAVGVFLPIGLSNVTTTCAQLPDKF